MAQLRASAASRPGLLPHTSAAPARAPVPAPEQPGAESTSLVEYGSRRVLVVSGVMLAVLLEILDTTVVNVALPTVQGNLGADFEDGSWIVTSYLIAVIIALPLVPWLEGLVGRRRYCAGAIIGFTVCSALCGCAQSIEQIIAFRFLQGLCGGGILTIARSILRDTFPPSQIGASQALLGLGAVVGPSVGPTVGGILTDALSWRWVFFVNIVPGLIAAALLAAYLREPPRRRTLMDGTGLALMIAGLGSLQYVLERGERYDWFEDSNIVLTAAVAAVCTVAFVVWELRLPEPIVDLRVLRSRAVQVGCALSFAIGFTLFVAIVLGPQFSQSLLGFTATLSGEQVLIRALAIAAFIPVAVITTQRLKIRPDVVLATGFVLVGVSGFEFSSATTPESDFWSFTTPLAVGGFGFGLLFVPLSVAVLSTVSPEVTTKVSALLSIAQQLGSSVATAAVTTIVDRRTAFHLDRLAGTATLRHFASLPASVAGVARAQIGDLVAAQASTLGFADAHYVAGVLGLVAVPIALLFPRPRPNGA